MIRTVAFRAIFLVHAQRFFMTDQVSRRGVLAGGAVAVAGVALGTALNPATAHAQPMGDVGILNALLAAEYNAIKAYDAGAGILMAPPAMDPLVAVAPVALAVALRFQSQHREHAAKLASMITAMGGTPVAEASVMFTAPAGFRASVANVLKLAANAEKGAAISYASVQKNLTSQTSAEVVAAIGGVETQHFITLYLLANGVVVPGMMAMVTDIVPQAFVSRVGTGTMGLQDVTDFTY
jgi:hypothetical protein